MDRKSLQEIVACLPEGRTFFHYHRDRYATYLLEHLVRRGRLATVADLKQSPYAGWLNKPLLRDSLAAVGRADIPLARLCEAAWCYGKPTSYLLSLGEWGTDERDGWMQTSRPGHNLVLHLDIPHLHDQFLLSCGASEASQLQRYSHPHGADRITLAWARMDIDMDSGQALIEEIQSDWMRDMPRLLEHAQWQLQRHRKSVWWRGQWLDAERVLHYRSFLQQHEKTWHEAMLTAALWFLFEEIGMREVFYHSWQTGTVVKNMNKKWCAPRSLYSDLPERFCFRLRDHGPEFIERQYRVRKLRQRQTSWNWYHWAA